LLAQGGYYCEYQAKQVADMKTHSFTAIVYKEDDVYIAECPEVGTVDQGETIEQAITGLEEATRLYLEEFQTSLDCIGGDPL
jgi:predicted RNase H-like HicB family nuclease